MGPEFLTRYYRAFVESPYGVALVAVADGGAVDRELRGGGTGGRLFEAYEELAREAGLRRLELVTLPDERGAAPFFDRLAWRREGGITSRSGELYALFTRPLDREKSGP